MPSCTAGSTALTVMSASATTAVATMLPRRCAACSAGVRRWYSAMACGLQGRGCGSAGGTGQAALPKAVAAARGGGSAGGARAALDAGC